MENIVKSKSVTKITKTLMRVIAGNSRVAKCAAALLLLGAGPTAANQPHAAAAVDSWGGQTDGHRTVT